MKILFVDESGDPGNPKFAASTPYFTIGGIIISEKEWPNLKQGLVDVKKKYRVSPVKEVKWAHLKSPKKNNPLKKFSFEKRVEFAAHLLQKITKQKEAKILTIVVDKEKLYKRRRKTFKPLDLYFESYSILLERFEYFLREVNELGTVIHDFTSDSEANEKLRSIAEKIINKGTYWTKIEHFFEGFLFVPSEKSVGIQYADFVVGTVSRYKILKDERLFKIIKNSFLTNREGQIEGAGLKVFPGK